MDSPTTRRRYVMLLGISATIGLAGCVGDGDDDSDANGVADDDSDTQDPGDDDPADDPGDADDADDDPGDADDADDDPGDADDPADDPGDPSDNPRLRDVFNFEPSYVIEFEFEEGSGRQVVHGEDFHSTVTVEGQPMEVYKIGTDWYTIFGDECYRQQMERPTEDMFDPEEVDEDTEEYVATGRTTIDGIEVYQFDVEDGVLYISVSTGYPVRFEGDEGGGIEFHSWGETDPISPPDMECN